MADREQEIRLKLSLAGADSAKQAEAALQAVKTQAVVASAGVHQLGDAYESLETALSAANRVMDKAVADAVEATRAQRLLAAAIDDVRAPTVVMTSAIGAKQQATKKATESQSALNSRVLEFGRTFQDVYQGGLAGGLNNIERLVGGHGALAGVLTVVGVLLYAYKDQIVAAAEASGLLGERVDTNGLLGAFDRLQAGLKKTTAELDALREKQRLTVQEAMRFKELTEQQAALETKIAEEREKKRIDERLAGLRPQDEKDRAAGFEKAVGEAGGGKVVTDMLAQALYNIATQTGQEFTLKGLGEQAEKMMRDAASGEKKARNDIERALRNFGGGERGRDVADLIETESPEFKADYERTEQELEESIRLQREGRKKRDAREKKEKKEAEDRSRETQKDLEERGKQRDKDESDLMRGLDDQFLAGAGAERLAAMNAPPGQREEALVAYRDRLQRAAMARLVHRGVEPGRAEQLAGRAPEIVEDKLARMLQASREQVRAAGTGLNASAQNQVAIANLFGALQQVAAGQAALERNAAALARNTGQFAQGIAGRRGTGLPRGNFGP